MLRRRLNALSAIAVAGALVSGCASGDTDGSSADTAVPVTTPVDADTAARCDEDADALRAAIAAFEAAEGTPPESDAALVSTGHLDAESDLFEVVDGRIEASNNACKGSVPVTAPSGSAPLTAPATELGQIVTDDELLTAADVFATMSADDVAAFGGEACALELADVFAAAERFIAREGSEPTSLDELAGDLEQPVRLWVLDAAGLRLVPAEGSPCPDVFDESTTAG